MHRSSFELLDGSWLVWDEEPEPDAFRELEAWALVPETSEDDPSRDVSTWKDALDAGPLLYVAFSGVVGNAAWSIFPAAARFVRARWHASTTVDAARAATRAREAVASTAGLAESGISAKEVVRNGDGTWRVTLSLADGRIARCRLDHRAVVVHVRLN